MQPWNRKSSGVRPRTLLFILLATTLVTGSLLAQTPGTPPSDWVPPWGTTEIEVTAQRVPIPLRECPTATTIVDTEFIETMLPRPAAIDEVLEFVPGVQVDNHLNQGMVHMYIRGEGILTEEGLRGTQVLVDGIPLSDPSGLVHDLYDIDWSTVERVEVIRGPAASLYGSGASGGVVQIITRQGTGKPVDGTVSAESGSNGYWKAFGEVGGGGNGNYNWRVSSSRAFEDGYRDHSSFWSTNLNGTFHWKLDDKGSGINVLLQGVNYMGQNPEGLGPGWERRDRQMANPDSLTYDEYRRTRSTLLGVSGKFVLNPDNDISFSVYNRWAQYREAVVDSVEHQKGSQPGLTFQYSWHAGTVGQTRNHLTLGADATWQNLDDYKHPNLGQAIEGSELLSDQNLKQHGAGFYLLDRLELGSHWSLYGSLRNDNIHNELDDHLKSGGLDLSGSTSYTKTTGRVGITYSLCEAFSLYASWGQGFMPPTTDMLTANPDAQGGFNKHLDPATSNGYELGARGTIGHNLYYEATVFDVHGKKDFERYRIDSRPLETFYRNGGSTNRYGFETAIAWEPIKPITVRMAYTYSHFRYNNYVFYDAPVPVDYSGNRIPNSPEHRLALDFQYAWENGWKAGLDMQLRTSWAVDPENLYHAGGYTILSPRVSYDFKGPRTTGSVFLQVKNATGKKYYAWTEPDKDLHSFFPAPEEELFLGVRIAWNH